MGSACAVCGQHVQPGTEEEPREVDLFDLQSLLEWARWADVAFVDTNWLVSTVDASWPPPQQIFGRRQDLPTEAFVPSNELGSRPVVSMSYGWAAPHNPDPKANYAYCLKEYFKRHGKDTYPGGAALFWDHKSLYQHKIDPAWDGKWDTWEGNLISRRTDAEERTFRRAMRGMQALYFHSCVDVLWWRRCHRTGQTPRSMIRGAGPPWSAPVRVSAAARFP
jgi:hypothetical protein